MVKRSNKWPNVVIMSLKKLWHIMQRLSNNFAHINHAANQAMSLFRFISIIPPYSPLISSLLQHMDHNPKAPGGDVLLIAHEHSLRVLAARWVGLPPEHAKNLELDTSVSVLYPPSPPPFF